MVCPRRGSLLESTPLHSYCEEVLRHSHLKWVKLQKTRVTTIPPPPRLSPYRPPFFIIPPSSHFLKNQLSSPGIHIFFFQWNEIREENILWPSMSPLIPWQQTLFLRKRPSPRFHRYNKRCNKKTPERKETERERENGKEASKRSKEASARSVQTACPSASPRVRPLVCLLQPRQVFGFE